MAVEVIDDPAPARDEVIVRIKAAALNHREIWICRGLYPGMQLPATLGADGAGVVTSVGADSDPALLGGEVVLYPGIGWGQDPRYPGPSFGLLGMPGPGTVAEYVPLRADSVFPKPAHLTFQQAAALPLAALTAWRGLTTKAALRAGETLLITGVGGGVAAQALSLAVAMGAQVWVTSGSDDTLAWAQSVGAKGGVNYREDGWGRKLGKEAGPINVVFDGAPAGGYSAYGRALAVGARVVVYGSTGGNSFPVSAPELFLKNVTIMGSNVGTRDEFSAMLDFVTTHRIVPTIERVFPLADAAKALEYLEKQHSSGKVVIEISTS